MSDDSPTLTGGLTPRPPHELQRLGPGRRLGEFVLERLLAEGGFGSVYVARQEALGRQVVVKVLQEDRANAENITRFIQEARLVAQFDHPYVAHVYAFGAEPDGVLWIAMEWVKGVTLKEYLLAHGTMPLEQLLPFLEHICEVVQAAHERGVVHRDLKPANVMVVSRQGRLLPKLLDFGIAKQWQAAPQVAADGTVTPGSTTSTQVVEELQVVGSPAYMAPEQWSPESVVDGRADVYALAVLCYQVLTGRPPFVARSSEGFRDLHLHARFPALGEGFSPALDRVLSRAAAKKPQERYATATEFLVDFRRASGLGDEAEVPRLDKALAQRLLTEAPRSLAETFAVLDAAGSLSVLRAALDAFLLEVARYLGALAVAARGRVSAAQEDSPRAKELLATLASSELRLADWCELAAELTAPFSKRAELHPLPELVGFFLDGPGGSPAQRLLVRLAQTAKDASPEALLEGIEALVRAIDFAFAYQLVVPRAKRPSQADRWMGARRVAQPTVALPSSARGAPGPVLLDADGGFRLLLYPLVQAESPSPGMAPELFVAVGRGRFGMRLMSAPAGYERQDEHLSSWLAREFPFVATDQALAAGDERAPYRGLSTFAAEDAELFFGREREVEAFVNRLRDLPLLAVVGPSGAGKSSFVQAGVLPALPKDVRPLLLRPGRSPLAALAAALAQQGIAAPDLVANPRGLGEHVAAAGRARGASFILVVDQLEEVVTLCGDAAEQARFAEAVTSFASQAAEPHRVIVTLRDDFLMRVRNLAALRERLPLGLVLLGTPQADDLMRILVEPAKRKGFTFSDPELPGLMVKEVAAQPGALALLSFTASKLWELRDKHLRLLTKKAYEGLGGVGGALAQHAEQLISELTPGELAQVREAFRHLVTADGTRAPMTRLELGQVLGGGPSALATIERLVGGRLLVSSEGTSTDEDRVEVTHEALLSAWPRLVQWQREDAESARLRDRLRAAAKQWAEQGKLRPLLWRKELLAEYRLWRARAPGRLTQLEEEFAGESLKDELKAQRLRRALLAGAFAVLAVFVAVLAVFLVRLDRANAQVLSRIAQMHQEQGRVAFLEGKPLQALAYLTEAYREGVSDPSNRYLRAAAVRALRPATSRLAAHRMRITELELTADGALAATASSDGVARVWKPSAGLQVASVEHGEPVSSVTIDPSGTLLVTGTSAGRVRRFRLPGGEPERELEPMEGGAFVRFSPSGKYLVATGMDSGKVRVYGPDGQLLRELPERGPWTAIEFDAAERYLALAPGPKDIEPTAAPKQVLLYELPSFTRRALAVAKPPARALAFFPDGQALLVGTQGGRLERWSTAQGKLVFSAAAHREATRAVAVSPDGALVATASEDGNGGLWSAGSGQLVSLLLGHRGPVRAVRFSTDGKLLATASTDHTARLWGSSGELERELVGHTDAPRYLAFLPGAAGLLSAGYDGALIVWSTSDRATLARRRWPAGALEWVEAADEGSGLLVGFPEEKLVLHDVGTGKDAWGQPFERTSFTWSSTLGRAVAAGRDAVTLVALPSGERLARLAEPSLNYVDFGSSRRLVLLASPEGAYEVWDAQDVRKVAFGQLNAPLGTAELGGDDRVLWAGLANGQVQAVTLADGKSRAWSAHQGWVISLELDAPRAQLVTGGIDQQVKLWRLGDGELLRAYAGARGPVAYAASTPNGKLVVAVAQDGEVLVWDAATAAVLDRYPSGKAFIQALLVDDERLLTVHRGELRYWPLGLSSESPAQAQATLSCASPYRVGTGELVLARASCEAQGGVAPKPVEDSR